MSIFEKAIHTVMSDLTKTAIGWEKTIIHSSLSHPEYSAAQAKVQILNGVKALMENALNFIKNNPDRELPDTFLAQPEPEKKEDEPVHHTVDIETGNIS